ncbi:hypothetical protein FDA94_23405 [Herbidospora galbida]|uniref:Uncharacterized protein n=2 Tax=Herbidospora galbida TaxID=2575442 RepID=A0A4V6XBC9_9ACTN|nr:hypothetical protein FDA94_23405 [Herbidospora galbida]
MTPLEEAARLAELVAELDQFLTAALAHDDPEQMRDPFLSAAGTVTEYVDVGAAGGLYRVWMNIDDIFDAWPVDYGDETDAIAMREVRLAVEEWLATPKTEAGISAYVDRWEARQAPDDWPDPGGVWIAGGWGGGPRGDRPAR